MIDRLHSLGILVGLLTTLNSATAFSAIRPNVIVIMSDDQGYGDMSCHGNPILKTPNIDALAASSVRLTDFHVAPMCTPTRGQLLTGLDALRNRAMNVSSGRTLLDRRLPTMATFFSDAGYHTGIFGKWHVGDNYPYRPQDRGFKESLWFPSSHIGAVPDFWQNDYFDDTFIHNGQREKCEGYCTDVWFDRAKQWIRSTQETSSKPFFAYLPLNAPHGPHYVPEKYRGPIRASLNEAVQHLRSLEPARRMQLERYLAMIANIDENVGGLLKFLDDAQLSDNTILIYLTDNGSTFGPSYFNAGMRGGKTTLWEGGHRVPCFIRWPEGKLGPPRAIDELTQVQDLLPTLLELCSIELEERPNFDGFSLASLLQGKIQQFPSRMLVVNYSRMPSATDGNNIASIPSKNGAAVLWKKWRLLNGERLYDVAADPGQTTDVSDQNPNVVRTMKAHLDRWWDGLGPDVIGCERVVMGNKSENPSTLTTCEWLDLFLDQQGQVRRGLARNGVWHLEVDHSGQYKIQLRRWPAESGVPLSAPMPAKRLSDGEFASGRALPIASAELKIASTSHSKSTAPEDNEVTFAIELKQGACELQATFKDSSGNDLCGAYYVTVEAVD
jgi:arylsulfatase A-like enzyme